MQLHVSWLRQILANVFLDTEQRLQADLDPSAQWAQEGNGEVPGV